MNGRKTSPKIIATTAPMTQAGITPVSTNAVLRECQRTRSRPGATQWNAIYNQVVSHHKAAYESHQRAQKAASSAP